MNDEKCIKAKKENKPFDLALKSCENDSSGGVPIVIENQDRFLIQKLIQTNLRYENQYSNLKTLKSKKAILS